MQADVLSVFRQEAEGSVPTTLSADSTLDGSMGIEVTRHRGAETIYAWAILARDTAAVIPIGQAIGTVMVAVVGHTTETATR